MIEIYGDLNYWQYTGGGGGGGGTFAKLLLAEAVYSCSCQSIKAHSKH